MGSGSTRPSFGFATRQLSRNILFGLCVQGVVTAVHVTVPYVGVIHTTAVAYARCRAEIRAYLRPFINWPLKSVNLVEDLSSEGCGRMTFDHTMFTAGAVVCLEAV